MNIWIPKLKIIEPNRELIVPTQRLRGFFKLEATDRKGRRRLLADWFPNLITDVGLNAIGTLATWMTACRVGTSNTAPAVSDSSLGAYVAGTSTRQSVNDANSGTPEYYATRTIVYRFATGVAAGNLAEIGIATASASGSGTLFSRALILDGGGSPTTITVLSDETLDVTYQLRVYPSLTDVVSTIVIDSVTYDYTLRSSEVDIASRWSAGGGNGVGARGGVPSITAVGSLAQVSNGVLGAVTGGITGTLFNNSSAVDTAYGSGNLYRDFTMTWGLNNGNASGGIRAVQTSFGSEASLGSIQIQFTPNIPKDNTKVFSLNFRHIWARGVI